MSGIFNPIVQIRCLFDFFETFRKNHFRACIFCFTRQLYRNFCSVANRNFCSVAYRNFCKYTTEISVKLTSKTDDSSFFFEIFSNLWIRKCPKNETFWIFAILNHPSVFTCKYFYVLYWQNVCMRYESWRMGRSKSRQFMNSNSYTRH